MYGTKSPGPDGMSAVFFKHYWDIMGKELSTMFRLIALYNVAAKIVGKVLATRLKSIFPLVISDSQSAFVPQRLITDNVLLSFDSNHFIKNQRLGKRGFMSIKLDMLKAYDRIEWSFLRAMLIK
ncbi:hypothetical protein LIER_41667 [Lithospermum erythrorhizon]|uniref:Reverse transcriptase domain-containing protein n=1 Tax=Lithospermum erythrorhizon TaxID=34254 RepID=A0AAV3RIK9_LITER